MKNLTALGLISASVFISALISGVAHADLIKQANLDIVCTEDGVAHPVEILIVSNKHGSLVTISGQSYPGDQLIGGTEGGDPYLQAVDNTGGYNITIAGGDFQKAFNGPAVAVGQAKASVDLFKTGRNFGATCKGAFEFTPMRSLLPPIAVPTVPITPVPLTPACVVNPVRMSTILMAATDELNAIKQDQMNSATAVTCKQVASGIVEYQFTFSTCGMCLPRKALLTVTQDETPTYRDGAPTYVKTVSITR